MEDIKHPLNRSIAFGGVCFILLFALVLSVATFVNFHMALYGQFEQQLTDILGYVDAHIDHDDLEACVRTGEESDKYRALKAFEDDVYTTHNMHFLYTIIPIHDEQGWGVQNVITALNPEEYAAGEGELFYLNSLHYDIYTPEQIQKFQRIMDAGVLTFSETPSEYGLDYTAIMPLKNSRGEVFALMCLDKPVEQIRDVLMRDTIIHLLLVAVLGLVVTVIFMFWIRSNVTKPILLLEKSVVEFANVSHDQSDPSKLVYEEPPIDTDNEVEMLSHAVTKMASDLRDYAQNLVDTQGQMVSMQTLVDEMNRLAHHDALTQVKNSTAYAATEQQLNQQIREGAARFALVMTDLNRLKQVNDTYGHEYGDDYLVGFAQLLTDSFPTSTVYRIGGDEFVVVLEGEDYERREDLCNDLRMQIRELTEDESRQPWARISAAVGLATYKESDRSVDDVFKRADVRMYEEKRHQGAGR